MTSLRNSLLILCFFGSILYGCTGRNPEEVLVIEKTKTYHTDECPRVNMAKTERVTIPEARALNCKACKACKPDERK